MKHFFALFFFALLLFSRFCFFRALFSSCFCFFRTLFLCAFSFFALSLFYLFFARFAFFELFFLRAFALLRSLFRTFVFALSTEKMRPHVVMTSLDTYKTKCREKVISFKQGSQIAVATAIFQKCSSFESWIAVENL